MKTLPSVFKSRRGEADYLKAYEESMRLWPLPFDSLDLESRFGRTHVTVSGPAKAPPLVLLHGYGTSSAMWAPNITELAARHRVHAVDVIGQAGKSVPLEPMSRRKDFVDWLASVLDGLEIERARIVGMSYGGWLTLNFASAAPERLDRIVLLSPAAGFAPLRKQFYARGFLASLLPFQAASDALFLHWISHEENLRDPGTRAFNELLGRQMHLGLRYLRPDVMRKNPQPIVFSDDELRSVEVPTLLLIGAQEVLYDPAAALSRAKSLMPAVEGELVPRASHDLSYFQHAIVDARILEFMERTIAEEVFELQEAVSAELWDTLPELHGF